MSTSAMQPAPQGGGGCGPIVVFMIATLTFVLGLLLGVGGIFGFLKADPNNVSSLGLPDAKCVSENVAVEKTQDCPVCEQKECPTPSPTAAAGGAGTYALVYPIEETLRIEGKIDRNALREYVIKRRLELQQCYQKTLDKDPGVKGEATLQFTISKKGNILAAVTRQDTVKNEELKSCLLDTVKSWNFKEAKIESKTVVIKLDILFTPIGAGGL